MQRHPFRRRPRMRGFVRAGVGAIVVTSVLQTTRSGAQPSVQRPLFTADTSGVVVDVVVRDSLRRPVGDLTLDDFEVFEDGRKQSISSFQLVGGATRARRTSGDASVKPPAQAPQGVASATPVIVALAFEQLGPEGRRLAERAASALVSNSLQSSDFAGVFAVDRALHVLVPYTNDSTTLLKGVQEAAQRPGYPRERAGYVPGAEFASSAAGQPTTATREDNPFVRGHATLAAVSRLIESLRPLPGRKSVILFSEGFALDSSEEERLMPASRSPNDNDDWLSDNRSDHFKRVLEQANHAQVAFYTFDAKGLRVESPFASVGFGRAPYVGLQFLADETGGAFIENTNDLEAGVRQAFDDMHQYYLLGYTSTKPKPDGKYRRIEVKVRRTGMRVLARKGYRAVAASASTLRSEEAWAFLLLDQEIIPNAFPMRAGVLRFPSEARPGRVVIAARVGLAGVVQQTTTETSARSSFAIAARLKDVTGRVVAATSDVYDVPTATAATAPVSGELLFLKELDVPAGVYSFEVIGYDAATSRSSRRTVTVDVPAEPEDSLWASSLFLVRRAERQGSAAATPALVFGEWQLIPSLGEPVSAGTEIAFAIAAHPTGRIASIDADATLLRNGQVIGSAPVRIDVRDDNGRLSHLGTMNLGATPPGTYQILVTMKGPDLTVRRSIAFTVAP